jgi:hypothetical protein
MPRSKGNTDRAKIAKLAEQLGGRGRPPLFVDPPDWVLATNREPLTPEDLIEVPTRGHRRATAVERAAECRGLNARRLKAIAWFTEQRRRAREAAQQAAPPTNPSTPTGHVYTGRAEAEVDLQTRRLSQAWNATGIEFR